VAATAQENVTYFVHTIEKGQSLYSISSMYGVSQADIIRLNPGSDEKIYVGRTLRIPRTPAQSTQENFHTITQGETLYGLTVKYGVSAKLIVDANPGLSADNFRIGEVIRIPAAPDADSTVPEAAPTPAVAVTPAASQSRCRDMHKVKRRETVFSISRDYNLTQEELIRANPELEGTDKLKRGSFLCIPYPGQPSPILTPDRQPTNAELFGEQMRPLEPINVVHAAIILPFLSGSKGETARMVEYYEGFLMAVDSLKREGRSVDLHVYNSGTEETSLSPILSRAELKSMDVIFGPMYPQHIKPLADFAQQNNIRLVIPFTSRDNTVFQNAAIYQINTPQSYLYSEVYDHFVRQFPRAHVIFIESAEPSDDKAEFIKGLREQLSSRFITTATTREDATEEQLVALMKSDRENIFIPTSGSNSMLIKILPQLVLLTRAQPDYTIRLFGYPEWQTYTKDHLDAFFELDTYFYSSFYTNNLLPAAINFTRSYRHWYGKVMEERYPKFGMLGFDTAYFFLSGLARYGSEFEDRMGELKLIPIQTGFKFERVNNFGGFINEKVFFVHFTRNYELLKLDFD
jgi:LysM repeat protein/ABC-type branched-subunit amino acid transport system substrate-binding protein